ncbi:unnamed protein product [Mycena citricolor]|uniref:Uncharacterized protein n=1 Tax=Mycena citricolor TaxID=2018698 RepID=A0AAD2K4A6_9AGAR|nr:unnamed protein product [Mycena citricolor]
MMFSTGLYTKPMVVSKTYSRLKIAGSECIHVHPYIFLNAVSVPCFFLFFLWATDVPPRRRTTVFSGSSVVTLPSSTFHTHSNVLPLSFHLTPQICSLLSSSFNNVKVPSSRSTGSG